MKKWSLINIVLPFDRAPLTPFTPQFHVLHPRFLPAGTLYQLRQQHGKRPPHQSGPHLDVLVSMCGQD